MWSKFRSRCIYINILFHAPDCNILYLNRNLTALNTNRFFFSSVDIPSLSTRALSDARSPAAFRKTPVCFAFQFFIISSPPLYIKNYNILRGGHISLSWFSCGSCSNWNWSVGLCGGRKTGEPEEKPLEKDGNQQQNQPKHVTRHESNPGYTGGRRAPSLIRYEGMVRFDWSNLFRVQLVQRGFGQISDMCMTTVVTLFLYCSNEMS